MTETLWIMTAAPTAQSTTLILAVELTTQHRIPTPVSTKCGNSALETAGSYAEACDDGNAIGNDGCTSCTIDETHTCSRVDNTASNPDTCTHKCGNAALDPLGAYTETCDDGNVNSNDGCSGSCLIEDAYTCTRAGTTSSTPDVCTARCGNSALDTTGSHVEYCDDGNQSDNDGCTSC